MTLKRKLQQLALFAAAGIGIGWGAFTLLMVPTDEIPSPLLWLGFVIVLALTLAAAGLIYVRARSRR